MTRQPKQVRYETSLVCHIDLLGFRQLVRQRTPGEISKVLRLFSEAVEPVESGIRIPELNQRQFVAFSDLHITVIPTRRAKGFVKGVIFNQILRLVHAQSVLFFDHGIIIRGGMAVGEAVRSYGRFFGQAIIDAYDLESQHAIFPRIVVDRSVFREIKENPAVWTHDDAESELLAVKQLLHHDNENGLYYIDYLRVIEGELDYPESYGKYLNDFSRRVDEMLEQFNEDLGIRRKLEWMKRYHQRILRAAKQPQ